ncbi:hypothetical protein JCGZ_26608 [Jatropha curcas]|uniref:Uncharacterized protein n=1 Tax=Jatropha curcas TaxID=180498 RepID=A0A067JKJ0_JATCU|nr:hypothetical protein JCGZ_26608 [Jatropha curcas]
MEQRVRALEQSMNSQEAFVGELSEQLDNVVQENEEITRAAKDMILELGVALRQELQALANEVTEVRGIINSEVSALRKEVDALRSECWMHQRMSSPASTSATTNPVVHERSAAASLSKTCCCRSWLARKKDGRWTVRCWRRNERWFCQLLDGSVRKTKKEEVSVKEAADQREIAAHLCCAHQKRRRERETGASLSKREKLESTARTGVAGKIEELETRFSVERNRSSPAIATLAGNSRGEGESGGSGGRRWRWLVNEKERGGESGSTLLEEEEKKKKKKKKRKEGEF